MVKIIYHKDREEEKIFAVEDLALNVKYKIQDLLDSKNLTEEDLAEYLCCSPSQVSRMLNEGGDMNLRTIAHIFSVLGMECEFSILDLRERHYYYY